MAERKKNTNTITLKCQTTKEPNESGNQIIVMSNARRVNLKINKI